MAFRINPIDFPRQAIVPPADFRSLTDIGDVVAAGRRRQQVADVLQNAPDLATAGKSLAQIGLIDEARPILALAQQQAALAQQGAGLAETRRHHGVTEELTRRQLEEGRLPAGFVPSAEGGLTYKPGGPADPDYIRKVTEAKIGEGLLDAQTLEDMAKQYRAGDVSVLTNLGRGAQGAENIKRLRETIATQNRAANVTPEEQAMRNAEYFGVKAGQRSLGTRGALLEVATTEFQQMAPIALETSKALSRTEYPTLNKLYNAYLTGTGDPRAIQLGGALLSLENIYARAVNPTGVPTDASRQEARKIFDRAYSEGQIEAAVGIMGREIAAMKASPEKVQTEMRERFLRGTGGVKSEAPKVENSAQANEIIGKVKALAQERIRAGADPGAELQNANDYLRRKGVPPISGF